MAGSKLPEKWEWTKIEFDQLDFMWGINGHGSIQYQGIFDNCLKSSELSSTTSNDPRNKHGWIIKICFPPKLDEFYEKEQNSIDSQNVLVPDTPVEEAEHDKIVEIFVINTSRKIRLIQANYTVNLLDFNYSRILQSHGSTEYADDDEVSSNPERGYLIEGVPINAAQLDHLMSKFILKLNISLAFIRTESFSGDECTSYNDPTKLRSWKESIRERYDELNGHGQDVILVSSDSKTFNASSAVLSYYSPVFEKSYKNHTPGENYLGFVKFDSNVVNATLYYMSHGEIPESKSMAEKVYIVADKFDITDLKDRAEETICKSLSIKDADFLLQDSRIGMRTVNNRIVHFLQSAPLSFLSGKKNENKYICIFLLNFPGKWVDRRRLVGVRISIIFRHKHNDF
ncbi:hypothetical protein QAD02_010111 [Eretmocerus hayati]|uniref:Uncharacterized protein n=1 Tax=Eretmocerus hayati TaxID=131215 RepID=A0ACC2NCE0_9HYME|nr:hypothetical protein QAD02_010111 [Eretmocerus hayati]